MLTAGCRKNLCYNHDAHSFGYRVMMPYKGEKMHTITTDNGSEFACHQWIAERLGAQVYFNDSYASWQKGAVENINKLVRQYIPKSTDISKLTDKRIMAIQARNRSFSNIIYNFANKIARAG